MEDVKWLLKKWGFPMLIVLIAIIAGVICWKQLTAEKQKATENGRELHLKSERSEMAAEEDPNLEVVTEEEISTETSTESAYWFIPQSSDCLINEEEKRQLQSRVLSAAESVRGIYKDIVIVDAPGYSSSICGTVERTLQI